MRRRFKEAKEEKIWHSFGKKIMLCTVNIRFSCPIMLLLFQGALKRLVWGKKSYGHAWACLMHTLIKHVFSFCSLR